MYGPPNDQRNFVHKRIGAGITGFISSGFNPLGAAAGFIAGGGGGAQQRPPVLAVGGTAGTRFAGTGLGDLGRLIAQGDVAAIAELAKRRGQGIVAGRDPDPCGFLQVFDPSLGRCVAGLGSQPGRDRPMGEAVMGRYGAGLTPDLEVRQMSRCLPGMVLGNDGICYNRGQVPNRSRMWPKGRRPLLTGGDMNAITKAARAARRVKATTKKLQMLGMLERPRPRTKKAPPPRMLGPGVVQIQQE